LLGKAFNPNLAYDSFRNTIDGGTFGNVRSRLSARIESRFGSIIILIKIENINPRVHKGFVGLECIRLI